MSETTVQNRLARVVHVIDPGMSYGPIEVVINRGAQQGVKLGDRYLVFGDGPMIIDPDSGGNLGLLEIVRGRAEVVHVQEHMATIRSLERRRERPTKRVVREAPRGLMSEWIGNPNPRFGTLIEEEVAPEVTVPFDHVRLGDQAKPI
jgi:hypothetical protein